MKKLKLTRLLMTIFLWMLGITLTIVLAGVAFLYFAPTFGGTPAGESLATIEQSDNFTGGEFVNLVETSVDTREPGESMGIASFIFPPEGKNPTQPVPSERFDKLSLQPGDFVWFGHSTVLFKTGQLTVLIDPVFNRASPVPLGGKPFAMEYTFHSSDIPATDVVLISHDHYDHLDYKAISQLAQTNRLFIVPLGNRAHLIRWGVAADKIIELDWYENHSVADTQFTLTPSRHDGGRGITNRNSTLWGSWVITTELFNVYFSGDSGYFDEFKRIGQRFGPFDIAFIENGAYDKSWSQIHMLPEESVQAAIDLKASAYFPIHWGKFDLAKHQWSEPIERAVKAARENNMPLVSPIIGQQFQLNNLPFNIWWKSSFVDKSFVN